MDLPILKPDATVHVPLRMITLEALLLTKMKNRLKLLLEENAEAQKMVIKNQWFDKGDASTAVSKLGLRRGQGYHPSKQTSILMSTVEERIEEALILCRSEEF